MLIKAYIATISLKLKKNMSNVTYLGGAGGGAPQIFTQPLKQHNPWLGQSVSLTPGLQQVLACPAHSYGDLGATGGHLGSA